MGDIKTDAASRNYFAEKQTGHTRRTRSGHCCKRLSELIVLPSQIPRVLGTACSLSELGQRCRSHQTLP